MTRIIAEIGVVAGLMLAPSTLVVATAWAQASGAPETHPMLEGVLAWLSAVTGVVAPPGAVVLGALYAIRRSCRSLDDVDITFQWEGRMFRFQLDDPSRGRRLDGTPAAAETAHPE